MQNQAKNWITKYNDVKIQNIMYDEFVLANDGKHVVSKIWYKDTNLNQAHTFYIQTHNLKIYEIPNNKNGDLLLVLDNNELFENIDKRSVEEIKTKGVHKKYGLVKPIYKSSINSPINSTANNNTIEVLRLKVGNCNFFYKDKSPKKITDVLQSNLLQKGSYVRVIIEIGMVMMNIEQKIIFTNLILKQAQILPLMPKVIDITEYSFVDDEHDEFNEFNKFNESNGLKNDTINLDNVILNTQTEYMTYCTDNKTDSPNSPNSCSESNKQTSPTKAINTMKLTLDETCSDSTNSTNSANSFCSSDSLNSSNILNNVDNTDSTNSENDLEKSDDVKEFLKHIAQIDPQNNTQKQKQKKSKSCREIVRAY